LLGAGSFDGAHDAVHYLLRPIKARPQKKGSKALDYGSPWNASAFPKVFLVLFVHKKNSSGSITKHGSQIAERRTSETKLMRTVPSGHATFSRI
jgi:hypothetical protein